MYKVKFFILFSLIISLGTTPLISFAQTTGGGSYDPNASSTTGKSFSGSSFSGVGGAVAGCANVGGMLVGAVSGLFSKSDSSSGSGGSSVTGNQPHSWGDGSEENGGGQDVPTNDTSTQGEVSQVKKEEKKANRTTECLNGVAYAVAKTLLQQVSNKTLNWVNKGLGGNPLYVQDLSSNLRTIRDEKLQTYLNTVNDENPIFGNAIRSAVTQQVTGISDGYLNKPMNTPEAKQYQAFQQNFSSGGWGALLNMNNNPVGALFNSSDKIAGSIGIEQKNRTDEVQRNNGFLDMRQCVEYKEKPTNEEVTCNGGIPKSDLPAGTACYPDITTTTDSVSTRECLRYKTVTPGSVISDQVKNVLGSNTRQLELADSINEVLGAFFDQLINNLFQRGLASLQGGGSKNGGVGNGFGSFGSNVVIATNGSVIGNGASSNVFGYRNPGSGYDVQDFDISRPQMLRSVLQAQYNFLNASKDSQIAMRSVVPTLGALDYCIPGPNPTWADGLDTNFQNFIGSFTTPSRDRTFAGKFLSAATSSTIQAIVKLFGGGGNTKELNYVLVGEPELFNKVSGGTRSMGVWEYDYYTKDYARGVKNVDGDWIRNWLADGYNRIVAKYQTNFTQPKITALFTAVDPDTARAKNFVKESLKETANLISYANNTTELDINYDQAISEKEDQIAELEEIRREALQIVKAAKARHIAEQAAAGTPVNLACINKAYVIDESPITGQARKESDIPNPIIQKARDANRYFYDHLN